MASSTEELVGSVALPKLSVDPAGSTTFVAVAELIADPTAGGYTRATVDMTHTDLTNGLTKQAGAWGTEAPYTFLCNYREDSWTQLQALKGVDGANWQFEWTDPGHTVGDPNDTFIGYITSLTKETPVGDRWTITVEVTPVETVVFTEGTDA